MRKMINGKIIVVSSKNKISEEHTICRSHSGDGIGWMAIHLVKDVYYKHTSGNGEYFAPENDIEVIGDFSDLIEAVGESRNLSMDESILDHIEEKSK